MKITIDISKRDFSIEEAKELTDYVQKMFRIKQIQVREVRIRQ